MNTRMTTFPKEHGAARALVRSGSAPDMTYSSIVPRRKPETGRWWVVVVVASGNEQRARAGVWGPGRNDLPPKVQYVGAGPGCWAGR